MTGADLFEAFGYRPEEMQQVIWAESFRAQDSIDTETLQTTVTMILRAGSQKLGISMFPDVAEALAEQLAEAAASARRNDMRKDPG